MAKKRYKKQTNAKSKTYKGIKMRSGLEVYMFKQLELNEIPFSYEKQKFVIIEGFLHKGASYERHLNGKGDFKDRGDKKISDMVYTPDFTPPVGKPLKWVIEVKGRTMPDFSRTWKLFKKLIVSKGEGTTLFMPRNQSDCEKVVNIIKSL